MVGVLVVRLLAAILVVFLYVSKVAMMSVVAVFYCNVFLSVMALLVFDYLFAVFFFCNNCINSL